MRKILTFLILIIAGQVYAQDLRGAYIRTKWISTYTYSVSVTLYTDASKNIIRPTIPVTFGDGTSGNFMIASTSTINGVNLKTYSGTHTYAGPGNYLIQYTDTFRVAGIKNMTNSQAQQMYVEAMLIINSINYPNTSPIISVDPLNFSVSGNQVLYNPGCSDADGDSISYELITIPVPNYYLPNNATINNTGTFSFSKDSIGLYSFAFLIKEWRKNLSNIYTMIGYSQIDFVMDVTSTIGINETKENNNSIKMFPNPASAEINIHSENAFKYNSTVFVYNNLWQLVFINPVNDYDFKINCNEWPQGIYFLRVQSGNNQQTIKFIKE